MRSLISLLICLCFSVSIMAQDSPEATAEAAFSPQIIEISAADGLGLVGDFYLIDPTRPTIVLLHQLYTTRRSWDGILPSLLANSYNVLAVDLRGAGQTGGRINWYQAIDDVALWLAWLRDLSGVNPHGIHLMGSSMGSTLAIIACANDEFCRSAIAISPGWNYYRQNVDEHIALRPVLAIYAERDRFPALGIPLMQAAAPESLTLQAYAGNAHGMTLLNAEYESLLPVILNWLAAHSF